ncbi:MAG: hypothetical protein H0V96_01690 [Acidimicrobiia bacterium]|nr:hypothetical protein [Acidimicrobiia bacterium]
MKLIAYLDPGTGSFIAQAVIGGAAGVAILVKTKGRQIFKRKNNTAAEEPGATRASEPDASATRPE